SDLGDQAQLLADPLSARGARAMQDEQRIDHAVVERDDVAELDLPGGADLYAQRGEIRLLGRAAQRRDDPRIADVDALGAGTSDGAAGERPGLHGGVEHPGEVVHERLVPLLRAIDAQRGTGRGGGGAGGHRGLRSWLTVAASPAGCGRGASAGPRAQPRCSAARAWVISRVAG